MVNREYEGALQKRNGEGVNAPLVILHVTAPAQVGGLERVVAALAIGQHRLGHEVHVAAVLDPGGADTNPLVAQLRAGGVAVEPIEVAGRAYGRERAAIRALCQRLEPSVVHTHGYRPDVIDSGVPQGLGIPTVSTVHGFTGGGWKNRLYEWLQERAYRKFDAVIAVSRSIVERLHRRGVPPHRIQLLRNAWGGTKSLSRDEARRALGVPQAEVRIGWVGRLTRGKGADLMIAALAQIERGVRLSVVGAGPEYQALRHQAEKAGVGKRVSWHGLVPDAGPIMPAFDVFVLSSRTEGTPIVLFEAIAAGVPVVTTAVGGVPDVVSGREAVLISPDNPEALVAAIEGILADPMGAANRAAAARDRMTRDFALEPWLTRHIDLYRSLSRRRSG